MKAVALTIAALVTAGAWGLVWVIGRAINELPADQQKADAWAGFLAFVAAVWTTVWLCHLVEHVIKGDGR